MADLDPGSLVKLRVVDLKEHLSNRGLSTSGLKAELVKRLREALLTEKQQDGNLSISTDEPMAVDSDSEDQNNSTQAEANESVDTGMVDDDYENEEILRLGEERRRKGGDKQAEEEKRLKEERLLAEEKKKRFEEEERVRAEGEKRREEERKRAEERKRHEVEENKRADERKRHETEERKRAEERKRREEERKRAEERKRHEEEERKRVEEKKRREEEERKRAEEKKKLEEERKRAEEKKRREEEERKRLEDQKRFEEEKRKREEEEKMRAEEEKLKAEAEKRKIEDERQRAEEETRRLEKDRKQAEEERLKEEKRVAAEAERRMAEEEEMKKEQERWLVEEQMRRAQEEHKKRLQAEEQKRLLDQQRLMEEEMERQKKEQKLYQMQQRSFMEQESQEYNPQADIATNTSLQSSSSLFLNTTTPVNILPPPPTVLMSNIPPPPVISNSLAAITPNVQVSAPPTRFPAPTVTQPFVTPLSKDTNSTAPNDASPDVATESMDTSENTSDIKLPQALEKVLALKTERAQQLGIDPDAVVQTVPVTEEKTQSTGKSVVTLVSIDEDEFPEDDEMNKKESKSRRRKKKKKKKRQSKNDEKNATNKRSESVKSKETNVDVDIEYVQEVIDITDPLYSQFMKIFEKFKLTEGEKEKEETPADPGKEANKELFNPMALRKKPVDLDDDDDDDDQDEDKKEEEKPKLSKRKLKKLSRMTVAELKQKVSRPELVEMHDVTAKDPVLLLHLKASRNTVPVPRHWCFKRKYLQGKRGIEKPAFELPDFIKRTGIMEMRQALQEKEDQKTMKAKMRERVRPKLGKIDIDYQKLHDAFFKWQTKPRMTIHGDLYYEGKEFETRLKEKKPGDLSEDLRTALGMPTGPNANKCPPPWLIAMQRYGPPPSYPNLKIPGLNAPIPDSCSFGYHAGGWGKPPVDETGRPLYGDVFGTQIAENQPNIQEEEIDHTLWGELESESSEEEEEEEDEEEEEEEEKQEDETGLVTPAEGLITPSGFSSIPAGMETPDMIELRKRKIEAEKEGGETPALYTILPEKKTERVGAAMMGSTHIYDLAAAVPASKLKISGTTSVPPQGIEVALDPSELEMDTAAMAARYEQTMREQQSQLEKEDLSDMVAEHAARQKNKRKKQQLDSAKPPKKYKEFKF